MYYLPLALANLCIKLFLAIYERLRRGLLASRFVYGAQLPFDRIANGVLFTLAYEITKYYSS